MPCNAYQCLAALGRLTECLYQDAFSSSLVSIQNGENITVPQIAKSAGPQVWMMEHYNETAALLELVAGLIGLVDPMITISEDGK